MRKYTLVVRISITILPLLFIATACIAANSAPAGTPSVSEAVDKETASPASPPDKPASDYFKYYNAIKLGMTIDEVNRTPGLKPIGFTDGTTCGYESRGYFGVLVFYNEDGKVYNKILSFNMKVDLSPLTPKPFTQQQCDQIKKGMTHTDVVKLLGGEGVECGASSSKEDCATTARKELWWFNADGTALSVYFAKDDTVVRTWIMNYYDLAGKN